MKKVVKMVLHPKTNTRYLFIYLFIYLFVYLFKSLFTVGIQK